MLNQPFYVQGLRFSCTRCSTCCRYESGFVFLSKKDVDVLVRALQMGYNDFIETYCRWVPVEGGRYQLSLKEKLDYDCIFWKDGCSLYEARPLQCRAFPFWRSILVSSQAWKTAAASCPGMGKGTLHKRDKIEWYVGQQQIEPIISRKA
jgi:Fe-S-cluster containining protein